MIIETEAIIDKLIILENILIEYNTITNMLLSASLEDTEETDLIFSRRSELINRINGLRSEITALIDAQTEEDAAAIRKMLSGQTSVSGTSLSGTEKHLHGKIIDIRSLQIDILKKDDEIALKFKLKREEIRSALADLQQDKKKINFYNKASANGKGRDFDSQN